MGLKENMKKKKHRVLNNLSRPLKHNISVIKKTLFNIMIYLIVYLITIGVFVALYMLNGVGGEDSLKMALGAIVGVESDTENYIYIVAIEKILLAIINLFLVGWLLAKILYPVRKIYLNDYCVYDAEDKLFSFRYWNVLPRDHYLYDANISIILTSGSIATTGINRRKAYWESIKAKDSSPYFLTRIRGDRYIQISGIDAEEIIEIIQKNQHDWKGMYFEVSIVATDEYGHRYHASKQYNLLEQLLTKYNFAPLHKKNRYAFAKYINVVSRNDLKLYKFMKEEEFQFFHAENFDYYYAVHNENVAVLGEINNIEPDDNKILKLEEVIYGRRGKMNLLFNWITWKQYHTNEKVTWKKVIATNRMWRKKRTTK